MQTGDRISADLTAYILTIDNLTWPGQRRTVTKRASAARSESAEIIGDVYAPSPAVTDSGGYSDFTPSSHAG